MSNRKLGKNGIYLLALSYVYIYSCNSSKGLFGLILGQVVGHMYGQFAHPEHDWDSCC